MSFILETAENGVQYLRSDLIGAKHGFATRLGGVSKNTHTASLNLAFGRGDDDAVVMENLRIFADAVGVDVKSIVSRTQIHSAHVIYADETVLGEGYFVRRDAACDGYVTDQVGVTLGVKTADCVPILFHDGSENIIGAVHAGWRGTASGIAAECVRKMCELGASVKNIKVAVGPCIHECCYEVGGDFFDAVAEMLGRELAGEFIRRKNGRLHADIAGLNRRLLTGAGIPRVNIDICEMCTCCHPELFYSHRYSKGVRGTMLSVIGM